MTFTVRPLGAPMTASEIDELADELAFSARREDLNDSAIRACAADLAARHGYPYSGASRVVFDCGDGHVVKLAYTAAGVDHNNAELCHRHPDIPLAACELVIHDTGVELLRMEKIREATEHDVMPAWVDLLEDGPQVGYTADGRLVAYDL